MTFTSQQLLELLPTIYRVRDAERSAMTGAGGPLAALIDVVAGQVAVLEEDLAQLYDDQFIETCAAWVAPYIGDLIGYRTLYDLDGDLGAPRAEVAHTIAFRRRKGTASMLEQVARDVTGWDASVVEYFQRLATTQYMNHLRPSNAAWTGIRRQASRPRVGSAFDVTAHTADVRRIDPRRGRYNIPNVGIHLWRVRDNVLADSPAVKVATAAADRRYLFSPLGSNAPLFNHAQTEDSITHLAERTNVPQRVTRRELWDDPAAFYPSSVSVSLGGVDVPVASIAAADLSDVTGGWACAAVDTVLIDPKLGRLALPATLTVDGASVPTKNPRVTFYYGAVGQLGGGAYPRLASFVGTDAPVGPGPSIGAAVASLDGSGVVEVSGNDRWKEAISITVDKGARIEVRAADGFRPIVELPSELLVDLSEEAVLTLNGFVFVGAGLRVRSAVGGGRLRLVHCTLVPGIALTGDGAPAQPAGPSIVVDAGMASLEIDHSIVGAIRADDDAVITVSDSIVDATDPTSAAVAGLDATGPGGSLSIDDSTIIGKIHARILTRVSRTILAARLAPDDPWPHPVQADRRQEGCIRFSYVPPGSLTPVRHGCIPATDADALRVQPQFVSDRFGTPEYGQLSARCAPEILRGSDDESEMGVYHDLHGARRETNLRVRLDEYLRFGLEAGIFYAS